MTHPQDHEVFARNLVDDDMGGVGVDSNGRINLEPLARQGRESRKQFKCAPQTLKVALRRPCAECLDARYKNGVDICFGMGA